MSWELLGFCALLLACGASAAQQRILLVRDIPAGTKKCLNTAQGWRYLTDDQGYVCTREQMDYGTGCCKTGQRHSCDKCKLTDKCCSEYEHCVSCCLAPQHDADKLHARTLRSPKNPSAGTWPSAWEYCRGICRTHSASTSHENAYINVRHHCFSQLGRPMLSDPLPKDALVGITVVMSVGGESCDEACSKRSQACSAPHLAVLNSCDRLREQVGCEAGCEASKLPNGSCPAYVESSAPKPSRPAMCFTMPAAEMGNMSCGTKDANARRLCPCKASRRY